MKKFNLKTKNRIHFVGIGGIGVSALARMFLSEGKKVSGSDYADSPIIEGLRRLGVPVAIGQSREFISPEADLIVYTAALENCDPRFLAELKAGSIPAISYPEALGLISQDKYTIAVSGTHGKTTTTAMIGKILIEAGLSPTIVVGSLMNDYTSNFVPGRSNYFLVEACEYKRSFLHLKPNILVITNIEAEHLDYYKNLSDIQDAFLELSKKLRPKDFLVCNINDRNLEPLLDNRKVECQIIDYHSLKAPRPNLKVPGRHNEENSKAAMAVSAIFGIEAEKAKIALEDFRGTWRRLEYQGKTSKGATVYDDYAHHPTEIKAALDSLKTLFPKKKIVVVFQPHLYSRTKLLLKDFAGAFQGAAELVLAPIYAAREPADPEIDSAILSAAISKGRLKVSFFDSFAAIAGYLKRRHFGPDRVIVTMGAGDIYQLKKLIV